MRPREHRLSPGRAHQGAGAVAQQPPGAEHEPGAGGGRGHGRGRGPEHHALPAPGRGPHHPAARPPQAGARVRQPPRADRALRARRRGARRLLFERPDGRGFDRQDIELCQSVALLAGRVLYQRLRQERPLWRRAATRCCAKRAACSARATSAASCWCWRWRRWRCSPRWPTGPIASARPPPCRAWCSAWSRRRSRAISPRPPAAPATRSGRAMCWPCWIPARPSWSCCAPATWRCSTAARARRPWRAATAPPPPSPRRRRARPWPRSSSTGSRSSVPACARRSTACWSAAT